MQTEVIVRNPITAAQVIDIFNIGRTTLYRLVQRGVIKQYAFAKSRKVYYDLDEIKASFHPKTNQ